MKKLIIVIIGIFLLVGCEQAPEKGIYKEGTYFGYVKNEELITTATIYVNDLGIIKSITIDQILEDENNLLTTGKIDGGSDWQTQIKLFEEAVLKEQDLHFIKWKDEKNKLYSDSIEGFELPLDLIYASTEMALDEAK
jgi:hypothetical protein